MSAPTPAAAGPRQDVPEALEKAAAWSWRLLVLAGAIALSAWVIYELRVVTVPIFLAVLASTILVPMANFLERKGLRRAVSTAVVFLGNFTLLAVLAWILAAPIGDQFSDLGPQVSKAVDDINNWLVTGPLELDQAQLDKYRDQISDQINNNASSLSTGAVHGATLAAEIFTGLILAIVLTFFFVKDGKHLVDGIIGRFPSHRQTLVRASVDRMFHTLGGYLRGVAATGFVDAFFIGIALVILGVPLVLPLVVLTFFGAFFPVVGATIAGALAAAVALVNGGATDAVIVILVVLAVQQLEGHILQPLLVGRAVALHPVVILVSLGTGAVVAGLLGAFVAVPLAAVIGAVTREIDAQEDLSDIEVVSHS